MLYLYIIPAAFIRITFVSIYLALLTPEMAAVLLLIINYLDNKLNNKYSGRYKTARL